VTKFEWATEGLFSVKFSTLSVNVSLRLFNMQEKIFTKPTAISTARVGRC